MMLKQGIIWLASYPKSGNTWFRIVLTHVMQASNQELDLNTQGIIGTGSAARSLMDHALGFDSTLLTDSELMPLRPMIYRWYGEQSTEVKYFKIHDMFYQVDDPSPLVPIDTSLGIIYFIRNPLDVVISFASHMNCSIDDAILQMNRPFLSLGGSVSNRMSQVRQICSSWSAHVKSWTSVKDIRLLVLRYEDMSVSPFATFYKALHFLKMPFSETILLNALEKSQFEKLKQYEQSFGFRESSPLSGGFFRKGIVGDWENMLSPEQINRIICNHGEMMRHFGYLDQDGQPASCIRPKHKERVL